MSSQTLQRIAVIGAGTMGRGIVQLFAQAGHSVQCYDAADGAAEQAVAYVVDMIGRGVEKGRHTRAQADAILAAIEPCSTLAELSRCDVVIEAIVENLEIKRELFRQLEDVLPATTILASNTSSLLVSEIASGSRHPERIAGLHFFNPVPLMKVVEVIAAVLTSATTVQALKALVQGVGHRAVVAEDQPGFLVNHAGRGLYTEGLRLLEEQVASVQDIDTVLREAAGFRMGPFELLDLTGLDVSGKVMQSIYEQFQHEARFRPSSLVPPRLAAGLYGRKSGAGWYRYEQGKRLESPAAPVQPVPPGLKVWIDPQADHVEALHALVLTAGAEVIAEAAQAELLIGQPWGLDASSYAAENGLDATRTVALDPLPGFRQHRTLMLTAITSETIREAARALLSSDGVAVTTINDSPGYIVQRVLATIVNIAANIAQRGIASVADIEDAVRMGLGYPQGPLSWGEHIGASRVLAILATVLTLTGDPRYRASAWLQRRAVLGVSLLTPEAARRSTI